MNAVPHIVIVAALFLIVVGVPLGLYALLTRGQRRTICAIRAGASQQGWTYRRRRWIGDPTAFQITAPAWIMKSGPAGAYDRGWTVRLGITFPALAGKPDFAIAPREPGSKSLSSLASSMPSNVEARIAGFSEVLAGEAEFYREAQEIHTGVPAFDAAYLLLALGRLRESPITPALAQRMLGWPADAVQPHSMLAWRDPYGLHLQARLPGPPNWHSVSYVVSLGEELASHLPASVSAPPPHTLVDRVAARLSRST